MASQLSFGSLETIMAGGNVENPVMQILGSKKMAAGSTSERYRLLISDGKHLNSFAMLATQLNEKVDSGELSDYSVVRVNRLITSMVGNAGKAHKRVLIILDLTVLQPGSEVGVRLGDPTPYEDREIVAEAAAAPSTDNGSSTHNAPSSHNPGTYNSMAIKGEGECHATHPINSLNPYQNHWTIKTRCTFKGPIKTWSKPRSEGKLFSVDFVDESGEIRCTGFNESVDKFYELIEIGKVYYVSNCQLKAANKQFTHIKHDYEMSLGPNSIVKLCTDSTTDIPEVTYNFVSIEKLEELEDGTTIDVIGVCTSAEEATTLIAKTSGKEFTKRDICLIDESQRSVTVTLWNDQAVNFEKANNPVIAIKNGRVKMFNGGKTVSLGAASTVCINPDIPESHRMRGWYENVGHSMDCKSLSMSRSGTRDDISSADKWCTVSQVKQLGTGDMADFVILKATIISSKNDRPIYKACPGVNCNKKVIDMSNGMYRCEKCNREYGDFQYRLLTRFNVGDVTGNQYVNCFHDQSETILGFTGAELGEMEMSDPARFESVFVKASFQPLIFKLRVKTETYNDTNQLKAIVMTVQKPMDYKMYNRHLVKELQRMCGVNKKE